jgi:hypothetical protein
MYYYAQIDENGIAFSILQTPYLIKESNMINRQKYDESDIGKKWDGVSFLSIENNAPEVHIVEIASDQNSEFEYSKELSEVFVSVGGRLFFRAELRKSGEILLVDDSFRFAFRSRDGRERVVAAQIKQGIITFSIHFEDSRVWELTEAMINADLPPERHMRFKGIKVFAVEA